MHTRIMIIALVLFLAVPSLAQSQVPPPPAPVPAGEAAPNAAPPPPPAGAGDAAPKAAPAPQDPPRQAASPPPQRQARHKHAGNARTCGKCWPEDTGTVYHGEGVELVQPNGVHEYTNRCIPRDMKDRPVPDYKR